MAILRASRICVYLCAVFCAQPFAQNSGTITYTLHRATNPTSDQLAAYESIENAMDSALSYYNKYTSLSKSLNVHYNPDVQTADANFNGTIRFGQNRSYMVVHTAMHEIAHAIGVGTTSEYRNLIRDGVFTGAHATAVLREITGDADEFLHGDNQHIWPYGLNYAHEVQSSEDLVNHCKIVNALYQDLFREELYRVVRLRSNDDGRCMSTAEGGSLVLGDCADSTSLIRMIALGGDTTVFRLEFGGRVLDIPNESTASGVVAGLWGWNGGEHQQVVFEFESTDADRARIKMMHSGLYLQPEGNQIIQASLSASSESGVWTLIDGEDEPVAVARSKRVDEPDGTTYGPFGLNGSVGQNYVVTVTDLRGRVVQSRRLTGTSTSWITDLGSGVYMVKASGKARTVVFREYVR